MSSNTYDCQVSVRVSTSTLARLKKIAAEREAKVTQLIRQAIREMYGSPNNKKYQGFFSEEQN